MEHVKFLHETSDDPIGCLLNPESVVLRRQAGVAPRLSAGGLVTGTTLTDDPLVHTGGGRTELDLDLLFDVALAGSKCKRDDVRELTRPFWELAENQCRPNSYGKPPCVRFVWGKDWNIPGVGVAVAERLENFTSAGTPRRSWLRMRMRRITEQETVQAVGSAGNLIDGTPEPISSGVASPGLTPAVHQVIGAGTRRSGMTEESPLTGERLDDIAFRYYGDASLWRLIASFNDISDPLRVDAGKLIELPHLTQFKGSV
jgi:hypothetical protein